MENQFQVGQTIFLKRMEQLISDFKNKNEIATKTRYMSLSAKTEGQNFLNGLRCK
jgi:hypothetical protein